MSTKLVLTKRADAKGGLYTGGILFSVGPYFAQTGIKVLTSDVMGHLLS